MENGSLVIARAAEENEGYFLCQASNGIGAGLSKVIHLNVYGKEFTFFENDALSHFESGINSLNSVPFNEQLI